MSMRVFSPSAAGALPKENKRRAGSMRVNGCWYMFVYPSFIQDFGYIRNDAVIQGFTFTSFGTTLGSRSGFLVHWFASSWPIFDMVLVCFGHICGY